MTPEQLEKKQWEEDLKALLSTGAGRRVFWRLTGPAAHAQSHTPGDTHHTAFLEGRRAVALELASEAMRVAPAEYLHLVTDALDAQRIRQEAAATRGHDGDRGDSHSDD